MVEARGGCGTAVLCTAELLHTQHTSVSTPAAGGTPAAAATPLRRSNGCNSYGCLKKNMFLIQCSCYNVDAGNAAVPYTFINV